MNEDEVIAAIMQHIKSQYGTMIEAAKAWDVTIGYVSNIVNKRKPIPDWLLDKIGYRREPKYTKVSK